MKKREKKKKKKKKKIHRPVNSGSSGFLFPSDTVSTVFVTEPLLDDVDAVLGLELGGVTGVAVVSMYLCRRRRFVAAVVSAFAFPEAAMRLLPGTWHPGIPGIPGIPPDIPPAFLGAPPAA